MYVLTILIDWSLYVFSVFFPRDKHLWVFIGWRKNKEREIFAENPKYQFLYVSQNVPTIRAIWIGQDKHVCALLRSRGYEAYSIHSFSGVYYSLRAGYTFVGGLLQRTHWRLLGTSKLIQLWHSKSLKKTGYNSPYGLTRYNAFLSPNLFKNPYRFIAISEFLSSFITTDFHVPKEKILVTGIPKHDSLLGVVKDADIDADTTLGTRITQARAHNPNRLLFYGPTFRPTGVNPLADFDLEAFNDFLKAQNDMCIISLHPKFSTKDWIPEGTTFSHILFSQSDFDIYPYLSQLDVLITDYSSLSFDFLLMGKPILLYAYDFQSFEKDMGVYEELWNIIPGPKVFTFSALIEALRGNMESYRDDIEKARATVFSFSTSGAAKRITDALLDS